MGFPGPAWGKNPFSRQIIGAALSCHCFTQRTKPPIIGEDNVLHMTDSPKKRSPQLNPPSLNLLLGKRSTYQQVAGLNACALFYFWVLALLEHCEFINFWASSTTTTVPLKS
jgi:hypothetical protein